MSLEFRTVKRNGILLSLSDIYEYPALTLEIYDGQVFYSPDHSFVEKLPTNQLSTNRNNSSTSVCEQDSEQHFFSQLMLSVRNEDGLFSATTEWCEHCLCDNKWHSVTAELVRNVATVRVDGRKLRVGVSKGSREQSLDTRHELYIGGFPGQKETDMFYVTPLTRTTDSVDTR